MIVLVYQQELKKIQNKKEKNGWFTMTSGLWVNDITEPLVKVL